jgi:uncharacterized protein YlxW (UPF0749 family)
LILNDKLNNLSRELSHLSINVADNTNNKTNNNIQLLHTSGTTNTSSSSNTPVATQSILQLSNEINAIKQSLVNLSKRIQTMESKFKPQQRGVRKR